MRNWFLLLILSTLPAFAADPAPEVDAAFRQILTATIENDYDKFITGTDTAIQATLKKEDLAVVSMKIRSRVEKGYTLFYFGSYQASGHIVHLWKIMFQAGGDDVLATMSRKDGRISGFYLN